MQRATELLTRLRKHTLDEQRMVVRTLAATLTERWDKLATLERDLTSQHAEAWALPGGPRHLDGYAAAQMECLRNLHQDTRTMVEALDLAQTALRARLQGYKPMAEADRRRILCAAEVARKQGRAEVEEACLLRLAHRATTGPVAS